MISNSQVPNCKISSLSVYVYFIVRSLQMPTIDLQSCRFVYSWFNHPGWVSYINPLPLENTVILAVCAHDLIDVMHGLNTCTAASLQGRCCKRDTYHPRLCNCGHSVRLEILQVLAFS